MNTASATARIVKSGHLKKIGVALVLLVAFTCESRAQNPVQPKRGFYPAGSYALSDIESINSTNGNVILRIPLASLPAGRGGSGAGVGLYYNSKPYETFSYEDERYEGGSYSTVLVASDSGGWRYGFRYDLQIIHRYSENQPLHPVCWSDEALHVWKVKIKFPDGSEHVFRPSGSTDPLADNFFRIMPDGWLQGACGQADQHVIFAGMTYYSADGSFMKLQFDPDGDHDPNNNSWTLSLPNGTRVTGGTSPQRIYDRNNNFVEIRNITYNGHPASEIIDELGRHIIVEYDTASGHDYVRAWRTENGQLTELVWTITGGGASANDLSYYINPNDATWGFGMFGPGYAVVRRIDLPAQAGGLAYTFTYNSDDPGMGWGELSTMTLPSGAQANYEFATYSYTGLAVDVLRNYVYRKHLTCEAQYDGASTPVTDTWQYELTEYMSQTIAPDQGVTREYFYQTNVDGWGSGLVYKTETADGDVIERIWQQNIPYGYGTSYPKANPYVKTEFTSIRNAGGTLVSTAIKNHTYDKNGNVTQLVEYDWVNYWDVPRGYGGIPTGIPGTAQVKRISSSAFYNSTPAAESTGYDPDIYTQGSTPAFRNAVAASEVSDGSQISSRVEFFYDNPATTANLIQKTSWDSAKGGYSNPLTTGNSISSSTQYNSYGNPILTTDARGNQTQLIYGNVGGFVDLYPTQTKAAYGTAVQRTETREYDFYSGLVTRMTDVDNNAATSTTYDVFGRAILVRAAENKSEETRTATEYSDSARRVIVRSDLNAIGDGKLVSIQHYDQLGRIRLSRHLEDAATQSAHDETQGIKVQTRYLFSGQNSYELVSNPYRANFSYNAGGESTMGWTRTKEDQGDRTIEVQTFGGAALPGPWGGNTTGTGSMLTAYDANATTVTDQAGKQRKSVTDSLGRVVQVYEAPNNPNYNYLTSYAYDASDNLTTVSQGSQTRSFVYDSLKRLSSVTNPESGNISYSYDENGNLRFKTDARGVVTEHRYDALNRVFVTLYRINNQPDPNTGDVEYLYDNAANGKGRPWLTITHGSSPFQTAVGNYDALGRVTQLYRCFEEWCGSLSYSIRASYDRAGHITSMTYPSGHTVTNSFDGAGRLNSFIGNLGDGTARSYATSISYGSNGEWTREQFGTNTTLYNKRAYNNRLQLFDMRVSTVNDDSNWNRGAVVNYYSFQPYGFGTTGPDDNGNLLVQQHWVPTDDAISGYSFMQQNYGYDALNRLDWLGEYQNGASQTGSQSYGYDPYGNRTLSGWGNGVNNQPFEVETATNRLLAPGDTGLPAGSRRMQYDNAGNLTLDNYAGQGTRTYDAVNRMKQAWSNGQWQTYAYDGDGKRVRRTVNGTETWQIYGLGGEMLAEYRPGAATFTPTKEYGFRDGELLITAASGDDLRLQRFVEALYLGAFARFPTPAELQQQMNALTQAGGQGEPQLLGSAQNIAQSLFQSAEYVNRNRSDRDYVSDLYNAYLQRAPDQGGWDFWTSVVPSNGRANVLLGFALSAEFATVVSTLYGTSAGDNARTEHFIHNAYLGALARGASQTELQQYVAALNNAAGEPQVQAAAEQMLRAIFNSQEYLNRNRSDRDFVWDLYEAFLQRAPDQSGWDFWTNTVPTNGRANVLNAFAVSGHFVALARTLYREVNWLVTDQLGTPRMVIARSGSLAGVSRHDYLPFGEELYAGSGGRTTANGYTTNDTVRQKFTQKERDNETGLDYFLARYYSSIQGRFTSVDPVFMSGDRRFNPQDINLYAYCGNNPLVNTDPDGKYYLGENGRRVKVTEKNGQITVGKNASADLKRMAGLINSRGSSSAISEFMKVAKNVTKVHFKISPDVGRAADGTILGGLHQAHDKKGKALTWVADANGTGHFDGTVAFVKDAKGNLAYKEATITVFEGTLKSGGGTQQQTEDAMVAVNAHEDKHDTDQGSINAIKDRQEGRTNNYDVEAPAYKVGAQVEKEIKENRAKKPKI